MDKLEQIKGLIHPILESQGVDLVDLELKGKPGSQVLRIFVDIAGGISLRLCEQLSYEISDALDSSDLFSDRYRLEVSSPGLDRRLKTERDFQRNMGRKVTIHYRDKNHDLDTVMGIIKQVDERNVVIEQLEGQIQVEMSTIVSAKLVPAW